MAKRRFSAEPQIPKYRQVLESLTKDILTGKYQPRQKFPSEAALVQQFATSRITIGRALRELSQKGLIERIAGSGTYVRPTRQSKENLVFGLLIPDLGHTEIFEPICQGIAGAPQGREHALLWGHAASAGASLAEQALELCDRYIQRNVAGLFFAPLEAGDPSGVTNMTILSRLEKARIPIVLLDRCVLPYPRRSAHDLVGIDNRRAGYLATEHLLAAGAGRVSFVVKAGAAQTAHARITGFREALTAHGVDLKDSPVYRLDSITEASVAPLLDAAIAGDGFVCGNDRTAGRLMRVVLALGKKIPEDVRIVGIDDVEYASLLPIPLTTIHQPCREIGEAAMQAMLDRLARPQSLARDILLECHLVVRASCGALPV